MPPWLQITSTIIAATFTIGTITKMIATWAWANTIKRDLAELRADIARANKRIDEWDGSEVWGEVQVKVGNIEIDQKLLRQSFGYLGERLTVLENTLNAFRERRRPNNH